MNSNTLAYASLVLFAAYLILPPLFIALIDALKTLRHTLTSLGVWCVELVFLQFIGYTLDNGVLIHQSTLDKFTKLEKTACRTPAHH